MRLRTVVQIISVCIFVWCTSVNAAAEESSAAAYAVYESGVLSVETDAESVAVFENSTGTVLYEENSDKVLPMSHMAKLMTVLLTAEKIGEGSLKTDDTTSASANANSQNSPQIWLEKGEQITVDDLLKSVTVGNANDACVALAELVGEDEDRFADMMNAKAEALGMKNTFFADSTGESEETVSTAEDLTLLCRELLKYDFLNGYFTAYMETVRDGKTELVNLNRLVRSYKGIEGFKVCGSDKSGVCAAVSAERDGMSVTAVVLGCDSVEGAITSVKKILDSCFDLFMLYTPDVTDDMTVDIPVKKGETDSVSCSFESMNAVVIPRSMYGSVETVFNRRDFLTAPVSQGDEVGEIQCKIGSDVIFSTKLVTNSDVRKMNFKCGFLKLLYNLLYI